MADENDRNDRTDDVDDVGTRSTDVPRSRLIEERRRANAEKEAREAAEARVAELEARDKTEVERLTSERDALKAENATLKTTMETDRKSAAVIEAARDAGFHNPTQAARLLDPEVLAGIDGADAAKAAVRELARSDTHLVKPAEPETRKGVEKILANGERVDGTHDDVTGTGAIPEPGYGTLQQAYSEPAQT